MGTVLDQRDLLRLVSISRLSELLRMDRRTVSKRLADANLAPAGKRDGFPVYDGRAACEACLLAGSQGEDGAPVDPRNLKPMERRAWYQSERERMAVEAEARQLIPAIEVQVEKAEIVRTFVQFLDTLPDQLERDVALSPDQIEAMCRAITKQRAALYAAAVAELEQDEAESA